MVGIRICDITSLSCHRPCHMVSTVAPQGLPPARVHSSSAVLSWKTKVTWHSPVSAPMEGVTQMPTPLQSRQQQHQSPLNSRMSADKLNFPQRGHATCDLDSYLSFGPPGVLSLLLAYSTDSRATLSTVVVFSCCCFFSILQGEPENLWGSPH